MFKTIFKILLYLIAILVFQELMLRFCFPLPELSNFDRVNYMKLAKLKNQYVYLRNQTWTWESQPDTNHQFIHKMNRYGFRDKEWMIEKKPGKKRILFVGDSFIEGIMAEQGSSIPKVFENELNDDSYEVWNGGMMGVGIDSYLMLSTDATAIFKPDYLFLCISGNDLSQRDPIIPETYITPEYYNKKRPRLLELINQIRLGSPVKFRWSLGSKTYIPSNEHEASPWYSKEAFLRQHVKPRLAEQMKQGKISPFRVNNLHYESIVLGQSPNLGEILPFFEYFCKKFNVQPYVVYIPSRSIVTKHYYQYDKDMCLVYCNDTLDLTQEKYQLHRKDLALECAKYNVPLIDLTEDVKLREDINDHLYWNYDEHMRAKGYEYLGKAIYQRWRATQVLSD